MEVTLFNFNVMPAQAPRGAFAGMTGVVGQSLCGLVLFKLRSEGWNLAP
jgi:hypothetical protein